MGFRAAPLLSPTEMASLPFPVALRTQWGHLVSRPLLVWASVRGFTVVTEGPSDEPTVHTRAIQHFHAPRGENLKRDSRSLSRHVEGSCRHRRMALEKLTPLTSESKQHAIEIWDEESIVCSLGRYVVGAPLELSLATRFS